MFAGTYFWSNGILYNQDLYGYGWSSSASSEDSYAIRLYANSSSLHPSMGLDKLYGIPLRCTYGSTSARSYPVSLVFSGIYYWGNGLVDHQRKGGHWQTSLSYAANVSLSNITYIFANNLVTDFNSEKTVGFALRCINNNLRLHFRA